MRKQITECLDAVRAGASYNLCGNVFLVNGVREIVDLTDDEFDYVWDELDAAEGDDYRVRLAP